MHATGTIALSKLYYEVGDTVEGHFTVIVPTDGFVSDVISITMTGSVHGRYVSYGESLSLNEGKHDFFKQTVPAIPPNTPLPPGHHLFPFTFQLGTSVPASGTHVDYLDGYELMENRIAYTLEATVSGSGQKYPVVISCPVTLLRSFPSPVGQPRETVSQRVTMLRCLNQGTCEITATADADTIDVASGVLNVRTSVVNATSVSIIRVKFVLCREFALHMETSHSITLRWPLHVKCVRRLREYCHAEPIAPGATNDNIAIQFAMADVVANLPKSEPLLEQGKVVVLSGSDKSLFHSTSYYVKVSVQFASSLCSTVSLDLPITALPTP